MSESDLQKACLKAIKGRKDVWSLNVHGNPIQKGGVPDVLLCVRGRFVGIELKLPEASPKPHEGRQRVTARLITQAGGVAAVVTSVKDFLAVIDSVD